MIKLIVSDIDGCLNAGVGKTFNVEKMLQLQEYNSQSKNQEEIPALTVCSGRQQPYLEAILQLVNGYYPAIFENGAGLFDIQELQIYWSSKFTKQKEKDLKKIKSIIENKFLKKYDIYLEVGKRTAIGILGYDQALLQTITSDLKSIVKEEELQLDVIFVHFAIDILSSGINKGVGIQKLAELTNISTDEMAGIGDSDGDISLLESVKYKFAPKNASTNLKEIADYISDNNYIEGVLDIYQKCIEINKRLV